jgi:hypothetical protein
MGTVRQVLEHFNPICYMFGFVEQILYIRLQSFKKIIHFYILNIHLRHEIYLHFYTAKYCTECSNNLKWLLFY